ncbi:hypothetical protein WOLCODRAFT_143572 [Wolfiporia cocos MD-104 SS10]|uniref:Uncharacterized protein n=1 Tax=Wolfiporia cocos (strain MD-104) TaxID=742152 RepID=A0A2H3JUE6_WOLCO|nr:hypothetical protein WOLCODRAFT_143572 [Wolfiporia cocos MD-104 SS10]
MSEEVIKQAQLNSTNLRSVPSCGADKTHSIRNYIQSLKTYASAHAAEGKALALTWARSDDPTTDATPQDPGNGDSRSGRQVEVGFDTPILKPRVPIQKNHKRPQRVEDDNLRKNTNRAADKENVDDRVRKESQAFKSKDNTRTAKKDSATAERSQSKVVKESFANDARTKDELQSRSKVTKTSKRPRSPESPDTEHAARLAERRERRRAKRAIVEPKVNLDSDEDEPVISARKKGSKSSKDKKKSGGLSAGLALMHGFTAKNIGKNRLTCDPDKRRIGVFNKGKASAKVPVKKPSTKSTLPETNTAVFSELRFLSKTDQDQSDSMLSSAEGSSEDESLQSHVPAATIKRAKLKPKEPTVPSSKYKRGRAKQHVEKDSRSEHTERSDSPATVHQALKKPQERQDGSIIWSIEIEGNSLASGSESSSAITHSERDPTVVMNTRAFTWGANVLDAPCDTPAPQASHAADVMRPSSPASPSARDKSLAAPESTVSLGPSQSASQVGVRLHPRLARQVISKFFGQAKPPKRPASVKSPPKRVQDSHSADRFQAMSDIENADRADDVPVHTTSTSSQPRSQTPHASFYETSGDCHQQHDEINKPGPANAQILMHATFSTVSANSLWRELDALDAELPDVLTAVSRMPATPAEDTRMEYLDGPPEVVCIDDNDTCEQGFLEDDVVLTAGNPSYSDQPWFDYDDFPLNRMTIEELSNIMGNINYNGLSVEDEDYLAGFLNATYSDVYPSDQHITEFFANFEAYQSENGFLSGQENCAEDPVELDASIAGSIHNDDLVYDPTEACGGYYPSDVINQDDNVQAMYNSDISAAEVYPEWGEDDVDVEMEIPGASQRPQSASSWTSDSYNYPPAEEQRSPSPSNVSSSTISMPQFSQGRALLLGLSDRGSCVGVADGRRTLSSAEEDVARNLRGHWLPHRL